jgi:hypothetical protein
MALMQSGQSPSAVSAAKIAVLRAIKPYLNPAYRSGLLKREDYTAIALRLTDAFCARFRASADDQAESGISDAERQWIQSMVQREVDTVAGTTAPSRGSSPAAANAHQHAHHRLDDTTMTNGNGSLSAGEGYYDPSSSPFARHLRQLREFVERNEDGPHDAAGATAHHNSVGGGSSRRRELINDIAALNEELNSVSRRLGDKIAQLAALKD